MKRLEFEKIAQRVLDGTCGEVEFRRFEEALRESSELRRIYRETFLTDAMLERVAEEERPLAELPRPLVPVEALLSRQRRKAVVAALAVAAVVILSTAVTLHLLWTKPKSLLAVRAAPHTQWSLVAAGGGPAEPGDLRPGDDVRVKAGTIEMNFGDGVRGIVQGPARVVFQEPGTIFMPYGSGRFEVPRGAEGFMVKSRRMIAVDLGTAFGVDLPRSEKLLPEVHVFRGRVRAVATDGVAEKRELTKGKAARLDVLGRFEEIDPDPTRFFTRLPSDLPFVRLSFESTPGGELEVLGTHPAVQAMEVRPEGEVGFAEGRLGRAVTFGKPGSRLRTNWSGTLGDSPRTIAAWVKLPEDAPPQMFQTIAGWGDPTIGHAGKFELLLFRPLRGGGVLPRLSFDQFLFTGTSDVADGDWHHIAAVYDTTLEGMENRVRLYVDGVQESFHPELTEIARHRAEPRIREDGFPLVVGDLPSYSAAQRADGSSPGSGQRRNFLGAIDEVSVYEVALGEERIREMAQGR